MGRADKRHPDVVDCAESTPVDEARQTAGPPAERRQGAQCAPGADGRSGPDSPPWMRGGFSTKARLRPVVLAGLFTVAALAGAALITRRDD